VERQCAKQGSQHGMEGHAFLGTIAMSSLACQELKKEEIDSKSIRTWAPPSSYVISMNGRKIRRENSLEKMVLQG
jgi:hypothetical protein